VIAASATVLSSAPGLLAAIPKRPLAIAINKADQVDLSMRGGCTFTGAENKK
jgi:hypothetical protein